ncbi:hypothetical protein GCM10020221_22150 [Streptomyces thioluteus]|uniref:Type VII secretion protein EccB n=1 Tax=Streptomyces thioluteus TaxID=66431 RepID=A0ABN3WRN9_STRTU
MATRRDELNAYTFARKRMVAAFLQPTAAGSDEAAPRPLRAVLPGVVVGALVLAGFGAWGIFKPKAPAGWSEPGAHVIVGSKSTTRYVVLETKGTKRLHPVLNFSSAKLLLKAEKSSVIKVEESELDSGRIQRGPTLGIPYAPDRLPDGGEAGKQKNWAVCEQPGSGGRTVQKAVFLLADREAAKAGGRRQLHDGQALYVEGPTGERYLVDPGGTRHLIGPPVGVAPSARDQVLRRSLFSEGAQPQKVSKEWLGTLHQGSAITFPRLPGRIGAPAGVASLDPRLDKVGTVLTAVAGKGMQQYVVLPGRVATRLRPGGAAAAHQPGRGGARPETPAPPRSGRSPSPRPRSGSTATRAGRSSSRPRSTTRPPASARCATCCTAWTTRAAPSSPPGPERATPRRSWTVPPARTSPRAAACSTGRSTAPRPASARSSW